MSTPPDPKDPENWPAGHYALSLSQDDVLSMATVTVQTGRDVRRCHLNHEAAEFTPDELEEFALKKARYFIALAHPDREKPGPQAVRSAYSHKWPQPEEYKISGLEADDLIAGYQAKAPRVTLEHLHELSATRTIIRHGTLTLCIIDLASGFKLVGKSACADPANYDAEKGEHFAVEDALSQLWPLEGYLLAQQLWLSQKTGPMRDSLRHVLEVARFHAAADVDAEEEDEHKADACNRVDALTGAIACLTDFEKLALGLAYSVDLAPEVPADALQPESEPDHEE